ncbi:unnamed protein product [Malus baccata var. baccata]
MTATSPLNFLSSLISLNSLFLLPRQAPRRSNHLNHHHSSSPGNQTFKPPPNLSRSMKVLVDELSYRRGFLAKLDVDYLQWYNSHPILLYSTYALTSRVK